MLSCLKSCTFAPSHNNIPAALFSPLFRIRTLRAHHVDHILLLLHQFNPSAIKGSQIDKD
jgi:hypothetical protein